ncbi:hypothetical protein JUJ52_03920 [Virgibacillus sp. AGTR]|uniref:hypothetical protein n=1 Tax=Virgibacillus sp. AGTR TaxID=2812055 RepID=UPI001D16B46D|nr:hypothetical protein [Virgibacillus sp. AGTR]MCC2249106.1 hypothetical protein [Virgibacillus sp. AGTR]
MKSRHISYGSETFYEKSIYLLPLEWGEKFIQRKGSYYDYVAEFYMTADQEKAVRETMVGYYGFREIKTNNLYRVFVKGRKIVRVACIS